MDVRKTEQVLLISFCTLIVIPLLYLGRLADDNTLTSWKWVFSATGMLQVFFAVLLALPCAYVLSAQRLSPPRAQLLLFGLPFAAAVPLWQTPEAIIDASRYFVQAKFLSEYGVGYFLKEWGRAIPAWTDMPLVPFAYGLIFRWLGEERILIQLFNTLLFVLTCQLTYLIGKRLWDEGTGLNAGLLLLGIPYLLTQVPLLLVDVPTMFFITLAVYAFLVAVEAGGVIWISASGASLSMALFSKYSAWLMLGVIPLIALVLMPGNAKTVCARSSRILLAAGLLAGTLILLRFELFLEQAEILRTYQWSGLGHWQEGYLSTFLFQAHPFLALLALCGGYWAFRAKDKRFIIAAWFAAFLFLLQIKRMRYILPLFPLFALMAAYGLNVFRDRGVRRYICLCAAATSAAIAYCGYVPFLNSTSMANLQRAGRYLDKLGCESIEVHALAQTDSSGSTFASIPLLDYHTAKAVVSVQDWPTHAANGDTRLSSLRFTWEAGKPEWFARSDAAEACAVAVISSEVIDVAPAALTRVGQGPLEEIQRYTQGAGMFAYQTLLTLFKRQ